MKSYLLVELENEETVLSHGDGKNIFQMEDHLVVMGEMEEISSWKQPLMKQLWYDIAMQKS